MGGHDEGGCCERLELAPDRRVTEELHDIVVGEVALQGLSDLKRPSHAKSLIIFAVSGERIARKTQRARSLKKRKVVFIFPSQARGSARLRKNG